MRSWAGPEFGDLHPDMTVPLPRVAEHHIARAEPAVEHRAAARGVVGERAQPAVARTPVVEHAPRAAVPPPQLGIDARRASAAAEQQGQPRVLVVRHHVHGARRRLQDRRRVERVIDRLPSEHGNDERGNHEQQRAANEKSTHDRLGSDEGRRLISEAMKHGPAKIARGLACVARDECEMIVRGTVISH
jgi:hypothetical protein